MSDGNTIYFSRKLLKKFILLYKELTCLWDKNCNSYKVKQKRHDAMTRLTKLVQDYDPSATRVHCKRKIECMRTCVRREYKKIVESRQTATNENEVYTPQLWYYDLLSFIVPEENEANTSICSIKMKNRSPEHNTSTVEFEEEAEIEDDDDDDEGPFETSVVHDYTDYKSNSIDVLDTSNSNKRQSTYSNFEEGKGKRHYTAIDDEYDAIGINVAAKLRSLPSNMRILAEKLINDVLFQAQINALSTATTIITPDPFK